MKKLFLIIIIFITGITEGRSQDFKYEIGGAAGIGFYMGDANPSKIFRKPGAALGAVFRRNLNYRWAIKCDLATSGIKGDTKGMVFPGGAHYSFKRQLIDIGAQAEFNFFHYGWGYSYLGTKRFAPYLLAGIGITAVPKKGDGYFSLNIPLGVGLKYKLAERWNLGFEFSMRKSLGDKLDGKALDDPFKISSSAFKNTDWYSFTMFSITYDFGRKKTICNNL